MIIGDSVWLTKVSIKKCRVSLEILFLPLVLLWVSERLFHNSKSFQIGGGGGLVTKSCLTLAVPWIVACQAPLSMGFSRQEYWSRLPFPFPDYSPPKTFQRLHVAAGIKCLGPLHDLQDSPHFSGLSPSDSSPVILCAQLLCLCSWNPSLMSISSHTPDSLCSRREVWAREFPLGQLSFTLCSCLSTASLSPNDEQFSIVLDSFLQLNKNVF